MVISKLIVVFYKVTLYLHSILSGSIPLTKIINNSQYGYKMKNNKINHSFYIDDLKLYASNDNELEGLIKTVKVFSDYISMQFGLEKCAKASFKGGKLVKTSNIITDNKTIIKGIRTRNIL